MATFTEKLRILIETDSTSGVSGIKKLVAEVKNADGFVGKLKAGFSGAADALLSPQGLAAGAAVAVPALVKMAQKAEDTGIEIGKLRDATGLSADAASRWVETANDMGIGSDKVAGLIEKMTKNLGTSPDAFAKLGIEVKHASDGTVDMSATLLNAIDVLNKTKDPTARAAAGAKLFGKSWADAAELISAGAPEVSKRLKEVTGGAIFTDSQIKQSREFRDAMANLSDVGEHLALTIGKQVLPAMTEFAQAVAAGAPLLKGISLASETVGDLTSKLAGLTGGWNSLVEISDSGVKALESVQIATQGSADGFGKWKTALADAADASVTEFGKISKAQADAITLGNGNALGMLEHNLVALGQGLNPQAGNQVTVNQYFTQKVTAREVFDLAVEAQRRYGPIPRF